MIRDLDDVAARLRARVAAAAPERKRAHARYQFELTGWGALTLVVGDGRAAVWAGPADQFGGGPPTAVITMSPADAGNVIEGRANPVLLFMTGRIRATGDLAAAGRLGELLRG